MKKIVCQQARVLDSNELDQVVGGVNWDGIQTAISGDKGCQVGANETRGGSSGSGYGGCNSRGSGHSGGSSRVICTHFYRKGMMDAQTWRADLMYTQMHLSETTVRGYHYWAIPYVQLMRRNELAEKIMYPIAKYRAIELSYQMGISKKGSIRGKLIRLVIEPACYLIGKVCKQKDWNSLWAN
ncbi:hypothetical protein ACPV5O_26640 [Vibrio maritimus]|uniref:hypothetical protein n=1 Tax=Vibrio maritimus TaxID=990268 RepID=UPI004067E7C6